MVDSDSAHFPTLLIPLLNSHVAHTAAVSPSGAGGADGAGASGAGGSYPLRGKAAELLAVVVRQQGSAAYAEILPQLMTGAAAGPSQVRGGLRSRLYF